MTGRHRNQQSFGMNFIGTVWRVPDTGRPSVASGTGEAGALARDATRVHFDGFHGDRAPGADCWVDVEQYVPAERDAVVRRSLRPAYGNDQIRAEHPACEQSGPDGRDL